MLILKVSEKLETHCAYVIKDYCFDLFISTDASGYIPCAFPTDLDDPNRIPCRWP